MTQKKHPMQTIEFDAEGIIRFRQNKIVRDLLDHCQKHGLDLNQIATRDYTQADREQLAQLIGYSVSGYNELSYVSDGTCEVANELAEQLRNGAPAHDFWGNPGGHEGYRQGFDDGKLRGIEVARQALEDLEP